MAEFLYKALGYSIINCAMEVHNTLGPGFLEKVYENAMIISLRNSNITSSAQEEIKVYFQSEQVGYFKADIVVENKILLELKANSGLTKHDEAQLLNYLKATDIKIGYLINFGEPKLKFKRFIY
jgi:GxxExxY protein